MSENPQNKVLETAWHRYAQLDANARITKKRYMRLKRVMASLTVLAVLFAILADAYSASVPTWTQLILRILLIITPITTSIIAAFANKFQQGQRYLASRAAAEEILKEIYVYRTVLKRSPARNKWLSDRLADIQRKLFRAVSGELFLKQYKGDLPPYYDASKEYSDPGYEDLTGPEYVTYRLEDQLAWHIKKNLELQSERKRIQWLILTFGGGSAFLAAWGGSLVVWVALTSTVAAALIGWEELLGLDIKVTNYSRVILELNIIRDQWQMLNEDERTEEEASKMVRATENILWNQNIEFVNAMQKALAASDGEEEELIKHVLEKGRVASEQMQRKLYTETEELIDEGIDEAVGRVEKNIETSVESLHEMYTDMRAIDEEELALAKSAVEETVEDDFIDEDFGEMPVDEDFVDEDFTDPVSEEDENFIDEVWVDD